MTKALGGTALALALMASQPQRTTVSRAAAGGNHNLLQTSDGFVWIWGDGDPGLTQLAFKGDVLGLAAGGSQTAILLSDGSVWSKDARTATPFTFSAVSGLAGVGAVTAAGDHALAWRIDGSVWRWSADQRPSHVAGLPPVLTVAAGESQDLALAFDGTVWIFSSEDAPRQVKGLAGVVGLAAGPRENLAIRNDGTVWTWRPVRGRSDDSTPTPVEALDHVLAASAGADHALVLRKDGTIWSWGSNRHGELGDGTETDRLRPVRVLDLENVVSIAAGDRHSLALKSDGSLWTPPDIQPDKSVVFRRGGVYNQLGYTIPPFDKVWLTFNMVLEESSCFVAGVIVHELAHVAQKRNGHDEEFAKCVKVCSVGCISVPTRN